MTTSWRRRALQYWLGRSLARFQDATRNPVAAQTRTRRRILRLAAATEYGRACGLTGRESYPAFRERVPVVDWDTLEPWMARQRAGRAPVIVPEPIEVFEPTSGSTGTVKLVPYTARLLAAFDDLFRIWVSDLIQHGPGFTTGRTFASVSPPCRDPGMAPNGIPIGLPDDGGYLSPFSRRWFGPRLVAPHGLGQVRDPSAFRIAVGAALVAEEHLEVFSVWHPTYLSALLDAIAANPGQIIAALHRGGLIHSHGVVHFDPVPAERLRRFEASPTEWSALWPALRLISCWTDAGASRFSRALGAAFPGVLMQGKGLLGTEAPVTVPILDAPAPVPLVDHVFLELETATGDVVPLEEATDGGEYGVILSQPAGLLRYRSGDRVRVTGRWGATPCLRFIGRSRDTVDLVGEKLTERFVRTVLDEFLERDDDFAVLVADDDGDQPRYRFVTNRVGAGTGDIAARLDAALATSYQYRVARRAGQLGPVVADPRPDARAWYFEMMRNRGLKLGDIKYAALIGPEPRDASNRALVAGEPASAVNSPSG